jgi:hypothetical protein
MAFTGHILKLARRHLKFVVIEDCWTWEKWLTFVELYFYYCHIDFHKEYS